MYEFYDINDANNASFIGFTETGEYTTYSQEIPLSPGDIALSPATALNNLRQMANDASGNQSPLKIEKWRAAL